MLINFLGTRVNAVVYNDSHANINYVKSFISERNDYYKKHKKDTNLTLCGGDIFVDKNPNNPLVAKTLGKVTDACAMGNHELESGNYIANIINKYMLKGKMLAANILFHEDSELKDAVSKSTIVEKNGEKFGVIGVAPMDFRKVCFTNMDNDFFDVKPYKQTLACVEREVKKLEAQGINKIFLLAHTGEFANDGTDYYRNLARISGIDVIIGGHDHIQTDRWEETEIGEPVKIVATGKTPDNIFGQNLNMYGILEMDFDDDGVLIKDNTTTKFKKTRFSEKFIYPGVGVIKSTAKRGDIKLGHSEVGNLVADSNLWYVNSLSKKDKADIAIVNPGNIRADLKHRIVTTKDIQDVVPFTAQTLIKTKVTKKELMQTLKWCAKSTTFSRISPGALQVSGMSYKINPNMSISDVIIYNEDGSVKYNLDELDDNFELTMVYDDFLASGVEGLKHIKRDVKNEEIVTRYKCTRQQALTKYIKKAKVKDFKTPRIENLIDYNDVIYCSQKIG